jgi:hypothetical protein
MGLRLQLEWGICGTGAYKPGAMQHGRETHSPDE